MIFTVTTLLLPLLMYLKRASVRGKAETVNRYSVPCSYRIRVHTLNIKIFKALYKTKWRKRLALLSVNVVC